MDPKKKWGFSYNLEIIHVYISQKLEIELDDKVVGRHGNEGIIFRVNFIYTNSIYSITTGSMTHM